ncbi:nicotinate-nucleotide--dimethylbenzimidazole phosphoribosyltransferase [Clostridium chromiireducens]|uniref:Nicotinate-nucleotide--dimethylbenzimidazole phosphoribosyltransferase n=1 Tax=Clostridium chromiireducens TaxID=225345 RepID=A0A1V4I586_9CLOT|nr:nicotinate-nucleotide--dimethylbenzimidazole phosphoribosyltransferase [Clostridium chromiireducens]MVX62305.1 nicotinate-nucleotide--dimethylbenzimidazole phosphoribosyltransferase [Clostridium chromiireducens]OPJ55132.1 nicotinate-nucleotide--dimethylbenzimidazole phosphoribosyltransferase [Clostridium chromiireducens]RII35227.1 nicotinate-nucleotide--dimethylbenzimidazole phosphoribosyltransferase [Clostridium chromiireducens]
MNTNIKQLSDIINGIRDVNEEILIQADKRMTSLAKPLKSLGKLEEIAIKLSGITGKIKNNINKKMVIIMCSDNGVVEEGVASAPQSVTLSQTINFTKGLTGVAVLAKANNTDLMVVDVGINCDFNHPNVINKKIRKSTNNIAKESAMSYDEAIKAMLIGIECVKNAKELGYEILGVGEMGIGNTSTSSAVLSALTDTKVQDVVGRGAGITDEAFEKKKKVVIQAIEVNKPDKTDPIDVVSKVGGFDIAAMAGVFIGAAYYKVPVIIDGFISAVAAIIAFRLNSKTKDYMFTSHDSKEVGFKVAINELGLSPLLNLDMGLGEGSGCPLAFSIVDSACAVMNNMATFEEAEINDSYLDELKILNNI